MMLKFTQYNGHQYIYISGPVPAPPNWYGLCTQKVGRLLHVCGPLTFFMHMLEFGMYTSNSGTVTVQIANHKSIRASCWPAITCICIALVSYM